MPDTPPGLIEIDSATGVMSVQEKAIIDCDDPKIDYLEYVIGLADADFLTEGQVCVKCFMVKT